MGNNYVQICIKLNRSARSSFWIVSSVLIIIILRANRVIIDILGIRLIRASAAKRLYASTLELQYSACVSPYKCLLHIFMLYGYLSLAALVEGSGLLGLVEVSGLLGLVEGSGLLGLVEGSGLLGLIDWTLSIKVFENPI